MAFLAFILFGLSAQAQSTRVSISGFSPTSGPPGTSVLIQGANFTGVREVRFENSPAVFTVLSSIRISATVPLDATSGPINIIAVNSSASSTAHFLVTPRITSFFPETGVAGETITIFGANFTGAHTVRFNGRNAASFFVAGPGQINAVVPTGATSGPITVTTPVGTASSPENFLIRGTEPVITSFSPASALPGATVAIFGQRFTGTTSVTFNGRPAASFAVVAPTQINAVIPAGAGTGPIRVTTPAGTAVSPQNIIITLAPLIHEFFPTRGLPGTQVTINGENFNQVSSVRFSGRLAVNVSVVAPTQLHATVPAGAETGPITVTTPHGTGTSPTDFVVSALPFISEFIPNFGPPGTVVSITGENLVGAIAVRFNGKNAAGFTFVAPTQIHAVVPADATSGPISVTTRSGTGQSDTAFVVTGQTPIVSEFHPAFGRPGDEVVVHGLNFLEVTAVRFNGTNAFFSVTAPTQLTAVVPPGATTGFISVTSPVGTGASTNLFFVAPHVTSFSPTSGIAGDPIVIRGTNFIETSSVLFNQAPALFTVDTRNQITAIVPELATTGTISVTTPAGIVASTNAFTVLPHITAFSPLGGPAGTQVTLSGSGFAAATAVRFNGVPAAFQILSPAQIQATVPAGATTGLITVQTPFGQAESPLPFTVANVADLRLSLHAAPLTAWAGSNVTFTATITNAGPAAATQVVLTNHLPAGVNFISASANRGNHNVAANQIIWNVGQLNAQSSASLSWIVRPPASGSLTNRATVRSAQFDPNPENNTALLVTPVQWIPGELRLNLQAPNQIALAWGANAVPPFILESAANLMPPILWSPVPAQPVAVGDQNIVTIPLMEDRQFFRLRRP
jgi:large repetitive protein